MSIIPTVPHSEQVSHKVCKLKKLGMTHPPFLNVNPKWLLRVIPFLNIKSNKLGLFSP
jgi:hypothetical protein